MTWPPPDSAPRAATPFATLAAGSIGAQTLRSLRSLRPSRSPVHRTTSGPLPLMKPRAATGLDTNAPPPLVAGNEMGIIGPKRVNHCPAVARVCTALQVVWWNVAGPVAKRRRSAFSASPATGISHWSKKASQVRPFSQTCDTLGGHLRRFGL